MRHSLISPIKLHIFVGSKIHQKMRMYVIQGCENLWSTSMSVIRVTCDATRGLQCLKENCNRWMYWLKIALRHGEIMCQCFCTSDTVKFWRAGQCLDNQNREDFVYTCFKQSYAKWHIEHQKIDQIHLKLRPIPPSTHGASVTIWQLCYWLSTGDDTVWLSPCARINCPDPQWGMMGRNWVSFCTVDFRI